MAPRKAPAKADWRDEEISILHKVAEYMSGSLDLAELLSRIVAMVAEVTGADSCFIYLFDRRNNELVVSSCCATRNA